MTVASVQGDVITSAAADLVRVWSCDEVDEWFSERAVWWSHDARPAYYRG